MTALGREATVVINDGSLVYDWPRFVKSTRVVVFLDIGQIPPVWA